MVTDYLSVALSQIPLESGSYLLGFNGCFTSSVLFVGQFYPFPSFNKDRNVLHLEPETLFVNPIGRNDSPFTPFEHGARAYLENPSHIISPQELKILKILHLRQLLFHFT